MFPSSPLPGPRPRDFWYHVAQSTYVTAVTDWFLGFVGKAAHLTLILTTLYTSAELLPGVTLPGSVNNGVFVAQMLTLDVGGMGLAKLAMQARDRSNEMGARQAEHLSRWLIRIVIASLVTVALEQAVRAIPGLASVSATVEGMNVVIGGALTIARAICAVHYGRVMHLLHPNDEEELPSRPLVEELVRQAIGELATTVAEQQALAQVRPDIERHLLASREEASARPFEASQPAQIQVVEDPGQCQSEPLSSSEPPRRSEASATEREPAPLVPASRPKPETRASGASHGRLQAAYDLLTAQGQRISGRALAREAHVNRATASAWLAGVEGHRLEPAPGMVDQDQTSAIN
jgi:hypothetical protein